MTRNLTLGRRKWKRVWQCRQTLRMSSPWGVSSSWLGCEQRLQVEIIVLVWRSIMLASRYLSNVATSVGI